MNFHIQVPNLPYDVKQLIDLAAVVPWYGLPNQTLSDGLVPIEMIPDSICEFFGGRQSFCSAGFIRGDAHFEIAAHEDRDLLENISALGEAWHSAIGSWPTSYMEWLVKTSNRLCALSIPVVGEFDRVVTTLIPTDPNLAIETFTLDPYPVLFQTNWGVKHKAKSTSDHERLMFQVSFGDNNDFNTIKHKILATRPT